MTRRVAAATLKAWLSDGGELGLLDLREPGQYGAGHPFFAVPLPYSRFELRLPALAPNRRARLVFYDQDDGPRNGIAARAAERAAEMGYDNVHVLEGGAPGWGRAGYTLYEGVNLPSKAFGELVELARHTPRITAQAFSDLRAAGADLVLLDGRPFEEFHKVNVPGGICCPNGELALRVAALAPDPKTRVVVACAGRTRSIIGAQTLIDFGIPNPVQALENGTQGWFLAGLELERGANRRAPEGSHVGDIDDMRGRARRLAQSRGVGFATLEDVTAWLGEADRTTFLFDVRTAAEFDRDGPAAAVHAPGGQLVQATDHWVGLRGARLVLLDDEAVRAPVTASWLRQLGHEAYVLEGGVDAARNLPMPAPAPTPVLPALDSLAPDALVAFLRDSGARLLDLRPSMSYRAGHIAAAIWSNRPRLAGSLAATPDDERPIVLIAEEDGIAALAARDLRDAGLADVRQLTGGPIDWTAAGLEVVATPNDPADTDCIDFPFFTHGRNQGDAEAARQYLAWEIGLVDRLDAQERGAFRIGAEITSP
ncbi:MAG: rhodanese-like domain-containing protein [Alphaproteobacteria bacterium]